MSDVWKGVALPWGNSIRSVIEPKNDRDVLKSSILWILLTRKGDRIMLPEFGSAIPDAVFEQNDDVLAHSIGTEARQAINKWDDRIKFVKIEVQRSEHTLSCRVLWQNAKDPKEEAMEVTALELSPTSLSTD